MYKDGILNSEINAVLGTMGHTDRLCVSDCGLPTGQTKRVDLCYKLGAPAFLDVVRELAGHMAVEKLILAQELREGNPAYLGEITALFPGIPAEFVSHEVFKSYSKECKAIIRTGETTAYANVILQSACIF